MPIEFEFDVSELEKAFAKAEKNLSKNVTKALEIGAQLVATEARDNHDYTDRSNTLTSSIMPDDVQGSFASGDMSITVTAGAPYALFVEEDTKAHIIRPKHRKALAWGTGAGKAGPFALVHHPGTTGTHFLANALNTKIEQVTEIIEGATALSFEQAGFEVD